MPRVRALGSPALALGGVPSSLAGAGAPETAGASEAAVITRGYGSDRILVDRKDMVADNCESEMSKAAEAGVKCSYGFGNSRATIATTLGGI